MDLQDVLMESGRIPRVKTPPRSWMLCLDISYSVAPVISSTCERLKIVSRADTEDITPH